MIKTTWIFVSVQICFFTGLFAQTAADSTLEDSAKSNSSTTWSAGADAYYQYNFANCKSSNNNLTSFTNSQKSLQLGMITGRVDQTLGRFAGTLDIGFGPRAREFSYTETSGAAISLRNIKQAFISYSITPKLKVTAGKWGTHIGYEVLDPWLNRNYSMSYMFSYGPFSHTGVKAEMAVAGKTSVMLGVANLTDYTISHSSRKFLLAQVSTATSDDSWKFFLNYQGGNYDIASRLDQVDLTITGTLSKMVSVGYNGTIQRRNPVGGSAGNWWGSAVYVNVDPVSWFGITLRSEYFDDSKGFVTSTGGHFMEHTLSGNFKVWKFTIIPEFRFDRASNKSFLKSDMSPTTDNCKALIAAVFHI